MNQKALLEAALFVSDKPLSLEKLSKIAGVGSEQEVKQLLAELQQKLAKEDRGIELTETPEGYELRVKQEYRERVVRLAPFADLSDGMMRTLAIVAAKQPIKQSLIVKYQGNKTYGYVVGLEEKGLIKTEKYGRTKIITTTPDFEKYFGKSSEEIKKVLESKQKETVEKG
jgi:segregation and condensation protein B